MFANSTEFQELEDILVDEKELTDSHILIVHNDDVNTFEWVIESLMKVCKHSPEQAEQCSLLIHFKGQYGVKHGPFNELKAMKDGLNDRQMSATIESSDNS